jgi:hypothetical protein
VITVVHHAPDTTPLDLKLIHSKFVTHPRGSGHTELPDHHDGDAEDDATRVQQAQEALLEQAADLTLRLASLEAARGSA